MSNCKIYTTPCLILNCANGASDSHFQTVFARKSVFVVKFASWTFYSARSPVATLLPQITSRSVYAVRLEIHMFIQTLYFTVLSNAFVKFAFSVFSLNFNGNFCRAIFERLTVFTSLFMPIFISNNVRNHLF